MCYLSRPTESLPWCSKMLFSKSCRGKHASLHDNEHTDMRIYPHVSVHVVFIYNDTHIHIFMNQRCKHVSQCSLIWSVHVLTNRYVALHLDSKLLEDAENLRINTTIGLLCCWSLSPDTHTHHTHARTYVRVCWPLRASHECIYIPRQHFHVEIYVHMQKRKFTCTYFRYICRYPCGIDISKSLSLSFSIPPSLSASFTPYR